MNHSLQGQAHSTQKLNIIPVHLNSIKIDAKYWLLEAMGVNEIRRQLGKRLMRKQSEGTLKIIEYKKELHPTA